MRINAEICLIEKWRKALDRVGAFLIDPSKAFDCIYRELLLAKVNAYRLDSRSLYFLSSYLHNRKQRTKVNSLKLIFMKSLLVSHRDLYWTYCFFHIYL